LLSFIENIGLILQRYGAVFAQGLWNTLWLSFVSVFLGTFLGILVALGKLSRHKLLNGVVSTYIEIIRGTPILLQLYFFWLALPNILPSISDTTCILSALVVNASAYIAEVIRAGIQAVDKGQMEAARSCGMNGSQAMRYIIMPQAVKNILPAIGNEFVTMVKETSIIQYLGISDLMYNNGIVITATYNPLPCYYISALIYLTLNICLGKGLNIFEGRMKKSER
jgi:His/Glu/Gln/Arg/opine family amino acid ABC transporter permease subunit